LADTIYIIANMKGKDSTIAVKEIGEICFRIEVADRGIISDGPYRNGRHPIYLCYFVTHVGFLLANWSSRIIALDIVLCFQQISRILSEERILSLDESHRGYSQRARHRMIPFFSDHFP